MLKLKKLGKHQVLKLDIGSLQSFVKGSVVIYEDGEVVNNNDVVTDGEEIYTLKVYSNFIEAWQFGKKTSKQIHITELEPKGIVGRFMQPFGFSTYIVEGVRIATPVDIANWKSK